MERKAHKIMFLTQILTNEFAQNNCIHTIYTCHRCKKMKLFARWLRNIIYRFFFLKNDFFMNDYDNRHMQHLIKIELFLWFKFECLMYNRSNIGGRAVKHIVINEAMKTKDTNKQRLFLTKQNFTYVSWSVNSNAKNLLSCL